MTGAEMKLESIPVEDVLAGEEALQAFYRAASSRDQAEKTKFARGYDQDGETIMIVELEAETLVFDLDEVAEIVEVIRTASGLFGGLDPEQTALLANGIETLMSDALGPSDVLQ